MPIPRTEKGFEADIESYLCSEAGGYLSSSSLDTNGNKRTDGEKYSLLSLEDGGCQVVSGGYTANREAGIDITTLVNFIQTTQSETWELFERQCKTDPETKFATVFRDNVDKFGIVYVLKHGIRHRGFTFKVVYFRPESNLSQKAQKNYESNMCRCIRQFHISPKTNETIDMVLDVNGIPLVGIELKNQLTGQDVNNGMKQWRRRDARLRTLKFNCGMSAFFAVDLENVYLTTKLEGEKTRFIPFNQGSAGAGNDGGAGNPPCEDGYPTSHVWESALQKDSLLDIVNKFLHLEKNDEVEVDARGREKKHKRERIIFPRYHQLDCVRRVIADVGAHGSGRNYLIQHSPGSGKSNSIAWCAYRLASLHVKDNLNANDEPLFDSVIVISHLCVLDSQLQNTISGFDHALGSVVTVDAKMGSAGLRDELNAGTRLIVSTVQKFSVIFDQVENTGKRFAVIVDEAHESQTGEYAMKLKSALADTRDALAEYATMEAKMQESVPDVQDELVQELAKHGQHKNLTFIAFTATPKPQTLEIFGDEQEDGTFHPFHIYSMRQAIEEGFILNPLENYVSYSEASKLVRTTPENPELYTAPTLGLMRKYTELHPYAIEQKTKIIVENFREITSTQIKGRAKMMVVASSRLACVKYFQAIKKYIEDMGYADIEVLTTFTGAVKDPNAGSDGREYTDRQLNIGHDGEHVDSSRVKEEFHNFGSILIVADMFQTGFDEPLLHTLVVDKKLKGVKAVQTLSRVNRIYPGKKSTYILDFINTREQIKEAFDVYYTETNLSEELDINRIYKSIEEIREFNLYGIADVELVASIEFSDSSRVAQKNAQGKLTSALMPAITRYEQLDDEDRVRVRKLIRSFCYWYNYATLIVRMFDFDLHKEYCYLDYLSRFLKVDHLDIDSVDDKIEMLYYQLNKEAEGSIELDAGEGTFDPVKTKAVSSRDKKQDPLQDIIEKHNEQWSGDFTEADRVVVESVSRQMSDLPEIEDMIKGGDEQMLRRDLFPELFKKQVTKAYKENDDAFKSLFEDKEKYDRVMKIVLEYLIKKYSDDL